MNKLLLHSKRVLIRQHGMTFMPPGILKKVILRSLKKSYLYTINHFHLIKNYQGTKVYTMDYHGI